MYYVCLVSTLFKPYKSNKCVVCMWIYSSLVSIVGHHYQCQIDMWLRIAKKITFSHLWVSNYVSTCIDLLSVCCSCTCTTLISKREQFAKWLILCYEFHCNTKLGWSSCVVKYQRFAISARVVQKWSCRAIKSLRKVIRYILKGLPPFWSDYYT